MIYIFVIIINMFLTVEGNRSEVQRNLKERVVETAKEELMSDVSIFLNYYYCFL